ncbi:Lrp/AsnC family transcriptional regulator [Arthrobacter monumenti]
MDSADLDIVAALQIAPRVPANALAGILDEPASTVTRRLKRLQQERLVRVIGSFAWPLVTSGNPRQMWFRCRPGETFDVAERLKDFPEIQFLMATSGSADIYADVYPLLGSDITEIISSRIPSISGIVSTESQLILKSQRVGQSWRLHRLTPRQNEALAAFAVPVNRPPFATIGDLNEIEFQTLLELGRSARVSAAEVARKLNVSRSSAYRTIQTLLATGAISPRVEIEPAVAGYPLNAIVSLQVDPPAIATVLDELSRHTSARTVSMVAGKASVIHNGVFAGPEELARFITDDIGALEGVRSLDTCVGLSVLRRYWMDRDGIRIGNQVDGLIRR